jgi:hypothetical protein
MKTFPKMSCQLIIAFCSFNQFQQDLIASYSGEGGTGVFLLCGFGHWQAVTPPQSLKL